MVKTSQMKNKVTARIGGIDFTFVASESPEYIEKLSEYVNQKLDEAAGSPSRLSAHEAAVLTAANICDELFKANANIENMRSQLREYVEDAAKQKASLNECKRELEKARTEIKNIKKQQMGI